jgi:hypothetical protein
LFTRRNNKGFTLLRLQGKHDEAIEINPQYAEASLNLTAEADAAFAKAKELGI